MKNRIIVALSGEIRAGKTTLAKTLQDKYGFCILKTRDALQYWIDQKKFRRKKGEDYRLFLQRVGESLDKETNGKWVLQYFQSIVNTSEKVVIDSVRILRQVEAFRQSYGYQNVIHIHLNVSETELERRYFKINNLGLEDIAAAQNYHAYKTNATEKKVRELQNEADLILDTEKTYIDDNIVRVASFLRLLPSIHTQNVDVLIGGQFGSEGKGNIAAYIAPEYECLVRVGGPNAGHKAWNINSPDTFHLIPSGSRRSPNSRIILGPATVISLEVLLEEIKKYDLQPGRLIIDENCTIISQKDRELEEELDKIGSTKQGVGAATANNLLLHRLQANLEHKAINSPKLKQYLGRSREEFEKIFSENGKILLEGTQGTFLSLHHGIYPYVTSRDTCVSGCLADAGISPRRVRKIIMVTRTYPIRVKSPEDGTSGPFSRNNFNYEITYEELSARSGIPIDDLLGTEKTSTTHKQRRIAYFNWALFREACELNSPTDIALTFSDYLTDENRKARRYDQLSKGTTKFIEEIERCSGVPVSLISTHFNHRCIIDRRNWI